MESTSKQQEAQNIYDLLKSQIIVIVNKYLDRVNETPINGVVDTNTSQPRKKKTKKKRKVSESLIKVKSTVSINDNDLNYIKKLINDFNTTNNNNTIKFLSNHLEHLILENKFFTSDFYEDLNEDPKDGVADMNKLINNQKRASLIYKSIIGKLKKLIQIFPRNNIEIDDNDKKFLNNMEKYYIEERPNCSDLEKKYRKIIETKTELSNIRENKELRILHDYLRCNVYNNNNNGEECCDNQCCKSANELHTVIEQNKGNLLSVIDSINKDSINKDSIENSDETLYTKYFVKPSSCPSQGGKRRRTRRKQRKTKRVKRKNTRRKRRRN